MIKNKSKNLAFLMVSFLLLSCGSQQLNNQNVVVKIDKELVNKINEESPTPKEIIKSPVQSKASPLPSKPLPLTSLILNDNDSIFIDSEKILKFEEGIFISRTSATTEGTESEEISEMINLVKSIIGKLPEKLLIQKNVIKENLSQNIKDNYVVMKSSLQKTINKDGSINKIIEIEYKSNDGSNIKDNTLLLQYYPNENTLIRVSNYLKILSSDRNIVKEIIKQEIFNGDGSSKVKTGNL